MKPIRFSTFLILSLLLYPVFSFSVTISTCTVDGSFNNPEVVIYNHDPVFSWEYDTGISSFNLNVLENNTTIWHIVNSTNSQNTRYLGAGEGYRTFASIASTNLVTGITYGWNLALYTAAGSSGSITGNFCTVISSVPLSNVKSDLRVDFNNPFNPNTGQVTKFRYFVERNSRVAVKIYTLSGEYIETVADHSAYKDMIYTAEWDGLDYSGNPVPSGIYLVNLDFDEPKGITRIVIVTNK